MAIYGTSQLFDGRVFGQYLSQQHPVVDDCAILRNEDADSSCDAVESCLVGCVVKGQSHVEEFQITHVPVSFEAEIL